MVDQKDPRVGCTKEEMKSRIENYLPYLTDDDLKDIHVQSVSYTHLTLPTNREV